MVHYMVHYTGQVLVAGGASGVPGQASETISMPDKLVRSAK